MQGGTWYNIAYDDFEGGWGNFADGGSDADRRNSAGERAYIHQGSAALRIRDNSGSSSSVFHAKNYNVTGYSDLRVDFWFYAISMENGEDFFLEYSSNGGSSWVIVKAYVRGQGSQDGKFYFQNNIFYFGSVFLSGAIYNLNTSRARIRFRCDASDDSDSIYIDEVLFQGFLPSAALTRDDICPLGRINPPEKYKILPYDDITTGDGVEDDLSEISYIAFSNRSIPPETDMLMWHPTKSNSV